VVPTLQHLQQFEEYRSQQAAMDETIFVQNI